MKDANTSQSKPTTTAEARRELLVRFHRPVQFWTAFAVGPLTVTIYLVTWLTDPIWHNKFLFFVVLGTWAAWLAGYALSRAGRMGASVAAFVGSIMLFETIEMSVVIGTEATAVIGVVAVTLYAGLHSRRFLVVSTVCAFLSVAIAETSKFVRLWEIFTLPSDARLATQLVFGALLLAVMFLILRRSHRINDTLVERVETVADAQSRIIGAVQRVQPVIDEVVEQIRDVSTNFAASASEQAATTAEASTNAMHVRQIAADTATSAEETRLKADRIRRDSRSGSARLAEVETDFGRVVESIQSSKSAVVDLAARAENVEEILGYNREIGEQIKILAINAAVQAAKAGEHGAGFRVVASELRSMIRLTEENLLSGRRLLDEIRRGAKENAEVIERAAELLGRYHGELRGTVELIGRTTDGFVDAASSFDTIAESARRQEHSVDEMSTAMTQIEVAASQLEESSGVLLTGVERIVRSHQDLEAALAEGAG